MALPDDLLADVLRRLAPRSLAASRCVCKAWRDTIDARWLLLPHLLPHSVRGIFLEYQELDYPVFLARPSTAPAVPGRLDLLFGPSRSMFATVLDHCNGLLLYRDEHGLHVLNPATQRWASLPTPPSMEIILEQIAHLVFDPTKSPHYEVFLVPNNPNREEELNRCRQEMNGPSASIISGWPPLQLLSPSAAEDMKELDESLPPDHLIEWPMCVVRVFITDRALGGEGVYPGR